MGLTMRRLSSYMVAFLAVTLLIVAADGQAVATPSAREIPLEEASSGWSRSDRNVAALSMPSDEEALTPEALRELEQSLRDAQTTEGLDDPVTHIVRLRAGSSSQADVDRVTQLVSSLGGHVESSSLSLGSFLFISTSDQTAAQLLSDPSVDLVEENQEFLIESSTVRDGVPWNVDRTDQTRLPLDGRFRFTQTGAGVPVYVVDTGISFLYPTLEYFWYFGEDFAEGIDCNGHGTHVAGTVVDPTYGVAPGALLIPVKASIGCQGGFSTAKLLGSMGVIANDRDAEFGIGTPAVVNLSLGGVATAASQAFNDEVVSLIDRGFTVVVAAGNSDVDACGFSPAAVARAITVGATNQSDQRASFSNFGPCVDIFAPGTSVPSRQRVYSTAPLSTGSSCSAHMRGNFASIWFDFCTRYYSSHFVLREDGTSMAAPLVAGIAALHLERNPGLSPDAVRAAILNDSVAAVSDTRGAPNRLVQSTLAGFFDVPATSTFPSDINWLAAARITTGCGGNRFCPKDPVTREQMAAFLRRALS